MREYPKIQIVACTFCGRIGTRTVARKFNEKTMYFCNNTCKSNHVKQTRKNQDPNYEYPKTTEEKGVLTGMKPRKKLSDIRSPSRYEQQILKERK